MNIFSVKIALLLIAQIAYFLVVGCAERIRIDRNYQFDANKGVGLAIFSVSTSDKRDEELFLNILEDDSFQKEKNSEFHERLLVPLTLRSIGSEEWILRSSQIGLPNFPATVYKKMVIMEAPAGKYNIWNWGILSGNVLWHPKQMGVWRSFVVEENRAIYAGELRLTLDRRKQIYQSNVTDRSDRDIPIIRYLLPQLSDKDIETRLFKAK